MQPFLPPRVGTGGSGSGVERTPHRHGRACTSSSGGPQRVKRGLLVPGLHAMSQHLGASRGLGACHRGQPCAPVSQAVSSTAVSIAMVHPSEPAWMQRWPLRIPAHCFLSTSQNQFLPRVCPRPLSLPLSCKGSLFTHTGSALQGKVKQGVLGVDFPSEKEQEPPGHV